MLEEGRHTLPQRAEQEPEITLSLPSVSPAERAGGAGGSWGGGGSREQVSLCLLPVSPSPQLHNKVQCVVLAGGTSVQRTENLELPTEADQFESNMRRLKDTPPLSSGLPTPATAHS